jgi:hypothetical protein
MESIFSVSDILLLTWQVFSLYLTSFSPVFKQTYLHWNEAFSLVNASKPVLNSKGQDVHRSAIYEQQVWNIPYEGLRLVGWCGIFPLRGCDWLADFYRRAE